MKLKFESTQAVAEGDEVYKKTINGITARLNDLDNQIKLLEAKKLDKKEFEEEKKKIYEAINKSKEEAIKEASENSRKLMEKEFALRDTRLNNLEFHYDEIKKQQDEILKTLKDAKVYDVAAINEGLKKLEHNNKDDPKSYQYYQVFYWALQNYFDGYRIASSGLLKTELDQHKTVEEQIKEAAIVYTGKKVCEGLVEVTKQIPVIGSLVSLLDGVVDKVLEAVKSKQFEDKQNAIVNLINKAKTLDNMNQAIVTVALEVTKFRKVNLDNLNKVDKNAELKPTWWQEIGKEFSEFKTMITNKLFENIENNTAGPVAGLALADIACLIAYITVRVNNDELMKSENDLAKSLIEIVTKERLGAFNNQTLDLYQQPNNKEQNQEWVDKKDEQKQDEKQKLDEHENNHSSGSQGSKADNKGGGQVPVSGSSRCCTVFSQHNVKYDDLLLNYPNLLKSSLEVFRLNKILDLSTKLTSSFIDEVISKNDAEMLIAGLISVDLE